MRLRRLRAVLTTALLWGVAWMGFGAVLRIVWPLEGTAWTNVPTPRMLLGSTVFFLLPGLYGGICFALLLVREGRRRSFEELSMRRVALLGAIGGVTVPFIYGGTQLVLGNRLAWLLQPTAQWALTGSLCAATFLALARRRDATSPDRPLAPVEERTIRACVDSSILRTAPRIVEHQQR